MPLAIDGYRYLSKTSINVSIKVINVVKSAFVCVLGPAGDLQLNIGLQNEVNSDTLWDVGTSFPLFLEIPNLLMLQFPPVLNPLVVLIQLEKETQHTVFKGWYFRYLWY